MPNPSVSPVSRLKQVTELVNSLLPRCYPSTREADRAPALHPAGRGHEHGSAFASPVYCTLPQRDNANDATTNTW